MRVAACVIGILGGFFGIYFGQLLVTSTAPVGPACTGLRRDGYRYVRTLRARPNRMVFYLGDSGGVVALVRPGVGAICLR